MIPMTITLASIAMSLMAGAAEANVTITTGKSGGTYHGTFGANLNQILREHGIPAEVQTSLGSVENLNRIAAGEAQVGFTQGDVLASWLRDNPSANIEIVGELGQECVYVAVNKDGKVSDEDDLTSGIKIAVGEQGTGSAVSWDYLRTLEDDYAEASTFYQGGIRSLGKVSSGQLDAFMWVTSPDNLNHGYLNAVNASDSLEIIDLDDYSLNEKLPNGEQVYEFRDVVVKEGTFNDTEVEVPCTDVLVVADPNMDYEAIETVAGAVLMNSNRIRGL
ncbi:hypothetical protein TW86_04160 [Halomonas sp. S2151]|uniref:TAXI family TRAP transporter solute-binding subunit n=1 Tax=Halomonas sp. S2151 TaxID=579478 RepID=UPI00061E9298|nr:TAXI family TRAP transporter solute-binding subunit [Halomonas sp. S2151]KJZ17452.1 hypothetical protein TW86_04160 [Halomonas sp. S2151]